MAYADEIIYGIRGRDHIWHTRTRSYMAYADERIPGAHDRSSLVHRGWIFLCDDQAYENVQLRYGGTVCWYMSTVAHMSGPRPDDRPCELGGIVADGVVRVDHVRGDEPGAVRVAPVRGHDVAVPVGRAHGIRAGVGDHRVEHLAPDVPLHGRQEILSPVAIRLSRLRGDVA